MIEEENNRYFKKMEQMIIYLPFTWIGKWERIFKNLFEITTEKKNKQTNKRHTHFFFCFNLCVFEWILIDTENEKLYNFCDWKGKRANTTSRV